MGTKLQQSDLVREEEEGKVKLARKEGERCVMRARYHEHDDEKGKDERGERKRIERRKETNGKNRLAAFKSLNE